VGAQPAAVAVERCRAHDRFMSNDNTSFGPEENEHRFGFHKATTEGENATLPRGRAKSAAWTTLEDASMWMHKAIAEQAPVISEPADED
jgi:hypothetical protein